MYQRGITVLLNPITPVLPWNLSQSPSSHGKFLKVFPIPATQPPNYTSLSKLYMIDCEVVNDLSPSYHLSCTTAGMYLFICGNTVILGNTVIPIPVQVSTHKSLLHTCLITSVLPLWSFVSLTRQMVVSLHVTLFDACLVGNALFQ